MCWNYLLLVNTIDCYCIIQHALCNCYVLFLHAVVMCLFPEFTRNVVVERKEVHVAFLRKWHMPTIATPAHSHTVPCTLQSPRKWAVKASVHYFLTGSRLVITWGCVYSICLPHNRKPSSHNTAAVLFLFTTVEKLATTVRHSLLYASGNDDKAMHGL